MSAQQRTARRPQDLEFPRRFSTRPDYKPQKQRRQGVETRHIRAVTAATALITLCFVIIATLVYAHMSDDTLGDEIAEFAAAFFLGSIGLSYLALRQAVGSWHAVWTDRLLLIGVGLLTIAMVVILIDLH